ncbi:MAG: hypothetical protein B6229_00960 [Spirochaetaceae bacterium 4572_7]|nr:MAG: hypothetical protein B6229_00960 [Spirochaetaceae bacterium 4572_7]
MKIVVNSHVILEYELVDKNKDVIDSSEKNGVLKYIHGIGMSMPGIEKIVEGHSADFEYSGIIEPKDAYGEYQAEGVVPVPREQFGAVIDQIEEGKSYNFDTGAGSSQLLKILTIDDNFITVDSNHPYAGESIGVKVKVLAVRKASESELGGTISSSSCGCGGHDDDHSCSSHGSCCGSTNGRSGGSCSQ